MIDKKLKYKNIKGQKHMLAYITPGEAKQLEKLGGQKTMTKEGIPAYPPEGNYGSEGKGQGSGPGKSGITGAAVGGGNHVAPGGTGQVSGPDRSLVSDTQQYNHYEAISKNTGVDNNPLRPSGVGPGFIKPGDIDNLTLRPYEQRGVDFLETVPKYKYAPPSLQVLGNFNNKPNRDYFYNTVIAGGKIPGLSRGTKNLEQAYQDYMDNRMAGKTDAAGNPTQGFSYGDDGLTGNFIDDSDDSQNSGIMTVANNNTPDTADDTTTEDELLLRFLGADSTLDPTAAGVANTDELRAMILERAKNLYT